MPDKAWKAFERRIAKWFPGGRRRGADTRGVDAGKSDIIADGWSPECKLQHRIAYQVILDACLQAERNAVSMQTPVAILKRPRDRDRNAIVCMRLEVFAQWFLPPPRDKLPVDAQDGEDVKG